MATILIIEDDLMFSRMLEGFLQKLKYEVVVTHSGKDGLKTFQGRNFDIVLLDYRLPDLLGIDLIPHLKSVRPQSGIIVMTSFSDVRTAVKAIKAGALEYITKPINPDELKMLLTQAQEAQQTHDIKIQPGQKPLFVQGSSNITQPLRDHIQLVAPTDMTVIIEGESGTGKEYVANMIHHFSKRAAAPFVAIDCGVLSKDLAASELFGHVKGAFTGAVTSKTGQFQTADGGTLFLDEIGNLSYDIQMKLLRAIQERVIQPVGSNQEIKVDVRIISATNETLGESVKAGDFREDLYHRLNEFKITVPPLRSRGEELFEFVELFREEANRQLNRNTKRLSGEVTKIFSAYNWPGNLRELKNIVKRAVLLSPGEVIGTEALPQEMLQWHKDKDMSLPEDDSLELHNLKTLQENQEREVIVRTLQEVKFNKSKAAQLLNIDRKTLYHKIKKYGIE